MPERNDIAYRWGDCTLTFAALAEQSARMADSLAGVRGRIAIVGRGEPQMLCIIAACRRAGKSYLPLDADLPAERLRALLRTAGAGLLLYADRLPETIPVDFECAAAGEILPGAPEITEEAYLLFTSGSEGAPKGVCVSQRNRRSFERWYGSLPAMRTLSPDSVVCPAQFSFDLSLAPLTDLLCSGRRYTMLRREELAELSLLFAALARSQAELLVATPTFAELCLCDAGFSQTLMPRLKLMFFCGETLLPATAAKLAARFPGVRLLNAYGPTEATCAVAASEIGPAELTLPVLPAGDLATAAVALRLSRENELLLAGESVAGYLGGVSGGFFGTDGYRTGDLAEIRDGRLFLRGRRDRMIKYKGYRIEPAEVENALCALPGVASALVTARTLADGRVLGLKAELAAGGCVTAQTVRTALAERLPDYMIPRDIRIDALPALTPNAKHESRGN